MFAENRYCRKEVVLLINENIYLNNMYKQLLNQNIQPFLPILKYNKYIICNI